MVTISSLRLIVKDLWYNSRQFFFCSSIYIFYVAVVAAYLIRIPYNIVYYRMIKATSYLSCGDFYGRAFSVLFFSHSFSSLYPPI